MKTTRKAPVTPGRNLDLHLAMLGKSGNLTHADKRTRRNRDRSAQRRNSIKEQQ